MGGRSRSSSRQTSIVETDNSNTQMNDNDGLILNLDDSGGAETTVIQTDQGAIEAAFNFGGDALDNAFDFGAQSLQGSQEFGRDIVSEAQEISTTALQIAGNAQTNAFAKIRDIADSFTGDSQNTRLILLGLGGLLVLGFLFTARMRR